LGAPDELAAEACAEIASTIDEYGDWTVSDDALENARQGARLDSTWHSLYVGAWWVHKHHDTAGGGTVDDFGRYLNATDLVDDACPEDLYLPSLDIYRTGHGYVEGPVAVPAP
jgi:hypothetical protein